MGNYDSALAIVITATLVVGVVCAVVVGVCMFAGSGRSCYQTRYGFDWSLITDDASVESRGIEDDML